MVKKIAQQPLVHFLLIALVIFAFERIYLAIKKPALVITKATQQLIINQQEALRGESLTQREQQEAVQAFINQYVLVEASKKMGLDDDEKIRQRLVRKLSAVINADLPKPTDQQLQQHYQESLDEYREPGLWVVKLVPVAGENMPMDPFNMMELQHTKHQWMINYGLGLQKMITKADQAQWIGPVHTTQGWLYFQVSDFLSGPVKSYESVKRYVASHWQRQQEQQRLLTHAIQLKQQYHIELAP